ncbi:dihydrolipoyl dehydrogenase [Aquabacterium sp.]|uniref:dihydrolipoyl dehydrogenase n=1 Tax=Aquabacterium sp. TaxID=1872578 RepID=UPI002E2FA3CB|nr:dihydrolipoyl dehydrogenase [Aquabacterium sp.]HEX5310779.1 dihydrolipoyl dehydrogenase [Aquabacterium sp.]
MAPIDIRVPDIGDIKDAAVIEILVKPGQSVAAEQSLLTLESDKASMEVPCPQAGVVSDIKVKLGDRVSTGSLILTLTVDEASVPASPASGSAATASAAPAPAAAVPELAVQAATTTMSTTASSAPVPEQTDCDLLVLGGGPGGYSAAFRAADLGLKVILVERYAELGGVCLNVGCIPSKALLHVAAVMDEVRHFDKLGITFSAPQLDLDKLRAHKSGVTSKLTTGLAGMAKARKVQIVRGYGSLIDAHHLEVELTTGASQDKTGSKQTVSFKRCIIAAGSQAVRLPFLPDDARVVDSTGALALPFVPKRMLVIGGGIIGLEMATVYSTLGARVDVVEMSGTLIPGADRDLVQVWQKFNAHRFDRILLNTRTVGAHAKPDGIEVSFDPVDPGQAKPDAQTYDLVLQAVGRTPNGRKVGADKAGVPVNERGFITVDRQQRTSVGSIFAIGDIVGQPMLAHKAVHEGHVAAEVIAGELLGDEALARTEFDARVIPGVAYTDPEIAWVGLTEEQAKAQGVAIKKGLFPWGASGRALANGRSEGFTKLLFDAQTHRIVGGGIVGTGAGDLISEVALAIEMGADEIDIGKTIHPHPTLGESVGLAAEAAHGSCTDLMPVRKR